MSFAAAAGAAALALALAGCGGSGPEVPRGDPDARVGAQNVDSYAQVQFVRALAIASGDEFVAGGPAGDAAIQLRRARAVYDQLAPRVQRGDPVVNREVAARFAVVARALRQGVPPMSYGRMIAPLGDQLMDGVEQAVVPRRVLADEGVKAEAMRRIVLRMSGDYDAATSALDDTQARLAFEEAWGMWRRAQALTSILMDDLGPKQATVTNTINDIRAKSFPQGPTIPQSPDANKVDAGAAKIADALARRFGLTP